MLARAFLFGSTRGQPSPRPPQRGHSQGPDLFSASSSRPSIQAQRCLHRLQPGPLPLPQAEAFPLLTA